MTACWLELALVTGGAKLSVLPDLQLDNSAQDNSDVVPSMFPAEWDPSLEGWSQKLQFITTSKLVLRSLAVFYSP